jgi:hypothetical protein
MDHLRRLLTFEKDRWGRLGAEEPREHDQLPSFWHMDDDAIEMARVMGKKWKTAYSNRIRSYSLIPAHESIEGLNVDAILDMYLELGSHVDILILFSFRFSAEASKHANWANCHESFRNFTRLPPEDCARVVECMREISRHDLEEILLQDYPERRRWFIQLFHDDYDSYNLYRAHFNTAIHGSPPGKAHKLTFMSEDDFYAFRPEEQENPTPKRSHTGQHAATLFNNPGDENSQIPMTYLNFVPGDVSDIGRIGVAESKHYQTILDVELDKTREGDRGVSPQRVQHEALAAVLLPSASTTFIGSSSSFARLYHTLMYLRPSRLIECFDVANPMFTQFEGVIYWALWQMFSHTRIWYAGYLFDDELDALTEQTIEFTEEDEPKIENSSSTESFEVAMKNYHAKARAFRRKEYHSRLFGFPESISFEDVIASVSWANSLHATRQAMFAAFPREYVTTLFDRIDSDDGYMLVGGSDDPVYSYTDILRDEFDMCWARHSPLAQRRDCLNARYHVGALVDAVVRFITFSQIIEHTTHLHLDAEFLGLLTIWQFASTPKVNVLKYVIERIRPSRASVQLMRIHSDWMPSNMHSVIQMPIDLPLASKAWMGIFLQYAKWLKRLANLRATLVVTDLVPSMLDGIGNPDAAAKPGNPSHLKAIPADVMDDILLPFLGLAVTGKIGARRLPTQAEYKALNNAKVVDGRRQPEFLREYDPLTLPNRSTHKTPSESVATARSSDALGESTSARPAKRPA